jgi:hypothetical protein
MVTLLLYDGAAVAWTGAANVLFDMVGEMDGWMAGL